MKFIIDQQLPQALIDWLAAHGHDAQHVRLVGMRDADDRQIWNYAEQTGAVIVTKDQDFALLRTTAVAGPIVIWLRLGNATTPALLLWLEARWSEVEAALASGRPVIEVR